MVDLIEDSDVEEIENESSESSLMDKAFTEEQVNIYNELYHNPIRF